MTVMFLGIIVVSDVQSIAKLSKMSESLSFQLFFFIQSDFLNDSSLQLHITVCLWEETHIHTYSHKANNR